jgi:hypothetical protein
MLSLGIHIAGARERGLTLALTHRNGGRQPRLRCRRCGRQFQLDCADALIAGHYLIELSGSFIL